MDNLRVISINVIDSVTIAIKFTHELDTILKSSNFLIEADAINVPSPQVLKVSIIGDTATLTTQPLTQFSAYFIEFLSTSGAVFRSKHGDAIMPNDGVTNKQLFIGAPDPANPLRDFLRNYLRAGIYNIDDDTTNISKIINVMSIVLAKALYDIRQVKNENYLSFTVTDERKIRGTGPFDRLDEECAYEILRVGKAKSSASANDLLSFASFPFYPITLQKIINNETLTPDSDNVIGKFNINNLILNLSKNPITRITKITFIQNDIIAIYEYDITTLGYRILDSRYDPEFGFTYLQLDNNQIKLNDDVLSDPNFLLNKIIQVQVQYEYKHKGRVIGTDSVLVSTINNATREVLPPIINVFNLDHAPIVNQNGVVPTLEGISFIDANVLTSTQKHTAFITEIPFSFHSMPARPGEYSVDYGSGTVYVYGSDVSNNGTGPYPPLATYKYKLTYVNELDYVYDEGLVDLVALPYGNLLNNSGTINFNYEEVLVPESDYSSRPHVEHLNERINNNLLALNILRTKNSPITNVFRIYNESTGEIYNLSRWADDKVYFTYINAPNVIGVVSERASFANQINEMLFVDSNLINIGSIKVFKILLDNARLISSTEDSLGSSINSSFSFNNNAVFITEKWFDRDVTETSNINRLTEIGEYMIDYQNGILYCAVSNIQGTDIGGVSYKLDEIAPVNPHVITVDDIYYQVSVLANKNKTFEYTSFTDGKIIPSSLDYSDETHKFNNIAYPYQVSNNVIGTFSNLSFVPGVTSTIKLINGIFEYNDLQNNKTPYNFVTGSVFNNTTITISSPTNVKYDVVEYDGFNYFVHIPESFSYLSPNITFTISIIRQSDSAQLWNGSGVIVTGSNVKLILPGINTPIAGDTVIITYSISINNLSRVIVNYNRGDYYIDYSYLADEILVSYEYGESVIDFRQSNALSINQEYYVSYKVGALRDALLKNFGTLIDVPELSNFDIGLDRERYRDALSAGLESFIQGPTIGSLKNIGQKISHIQPEIIESAFENWSLGNSKLTPRSIETAGEFKLVSAKHGNGALINNIDQSVTLPVNSNLRIEAGSFESWLIPEWDGIDNNAKLTFTIKKNNVSIKPSKVFLGALELHPIFDNGAFSINKSDVLLGTPNKNKDGVFIYYDKDISGKFNRWYVDVIDGYTDGYLDGYAIDYLIKINTSGVFYDVKSRTYPQPSNLTKTTTNSALTIKVNGGINSNCGMSFISEEEHYLLDFGKGVNKNRLSLFKDASGYFNFRVYDKFKVPYSVSADISSWKAYEKHHISASWKLNTKDNRDELHLFIDGFEVPNIIRYGNRLDPYLHEKFRTINPDEIIGLTNRDIVGSVDLITTAGSNIVSSSINFSNFNIFAGDVLYIDEAGFSTSGYVITVVGGNTLTLSSIMPVTITGGSFSVNKTSFSIVSEIDVYPNIAVFRIPPIVDGYDLTTTINSDVVGSSVNFITAGVQSGYSIHIDGYNFAKTYTILSVSANSLIINNEIDATYTGLSFSVYSNTENEIPGLRAVSPSYSISKDGYYNNIITFTNNIYSRDLILIKTLGLNNRRVRRKYYVWGDNQESIIRTRLPAPISLDETNIFKIIVPEISIGPANSTLILGEFNSVNIPGSSASNSQDGRTLAVEISGVNADFSSPVQVQITGQVSIYTITETLTFSDYGIKDTLNKFISVDYIKVICKPINVIKNCVNVEIKEKYTMLRAEGSASVPKLRYAYNILAGSTLQNDGYGVRDENQFFSSLVVGNYLVISSPAPVAGFYKITGVSTDFKSLSIESTPPAFPLPLSTFTNGSYEVLNISDYRNGLQNGLFLFQQDLLVGQEFLLTQGWYEFDYYSYLIAKMDPVFGNMSLGSDFNTTRHINGVINDVKITSNMMTDTRIGEQIPSNQRSITKDYNSLKSLKKDINTLVLASFDSFPFINTADHYTGFEDKPFFQTSNSINDNFEKSVCITNSPIVLDNDGILDSKKEGTIEFWVNPIYDTANDPHDRHYFDASSAIMEEVISENYASVKVSGNVSKILSVKLASNPKIDYFAGGSVDLDTGGAISEPQNSINSGTVKVSKDIFQVISVKIANDPSKKEYALNSVIGNDKRTIYLGQSLPFAVLSLIVIYKPSQKSIETINTQIINLNKRLPNHKTKVVVHYIPKGTQGDRIFINKDKYGLLNFVVIASNIEYAINVPVYWAKGTWHRVQANYKFNNVQGNDEIRLFVDGYERGNALYGDNLLYGTPINYGASFAGNTAISASIKFKDPINQIIIGADYSGVNTAYALFDNYRISNISRPVYAPFGEALDINFNKNTNVVFPVTKDLYTTYLLNFETIFTKTTDFVVLKNKKSGIFDFSMNVFDSLGIINNSDKIKEILEALVKRLKPANSRAFIRYIV